MLLEFYAHNLELRCAPLARAHPLLKEPPQVPCLSRSWVKLVCGPDVTASSMSFPVDYCPHRAAFSFWMFPFGFERGARMRRMSAKASRKLLFTVGVCACAHAHLCRPNKVTARPRDGWARCLDQNKIRKNERRIEKHCLLQERTAPRQRGRGLGIWDCIRRAL